jgi:hypothetical protein
VSTYLEQLTPRWISVQSYWYQSCLNRNSFSNNRDCGPLDAPKTSQRQQTACQQRREGRGGGATAGGPGQARISGRCARAGASSAAWAACSAPAKRFARPALRWANCQPASSECLVEWTPQGCTRCTRVTFCSRCASRAIARDARCTARGPRRISACLGAMGLAGPRPTMGLAGPRPTKRCSRLRRRGRWPACCRARCPRSPHRGCAPASGSPPAPSRCAPAPRARAANERARGASRNHLATSRTIPPHTLLTVHVFAVAVFAAQKRVALVLAALVRRPHALAP